MMTLNIYSRFIYHQGEIDGHILTDKALGLRISGNNLINSNNNYPEFIWLPLSQIKMIPYGKYTQIQMPSWLWDNNRLGLYHYLGEEG